MKQDFRQGLIERMSFRMRQCGLNSTDFADAIGVTKQQVSNWTKTGGANMPTLEQMQRMAAVLRTSCDYLLGVTSDPSPPTREQLRLPRPQLEAALEDITSAAEHLRSALFGHVASGAEQSDQRPPVGGDAAARDVLQDLTMPTAAAVARQPGSARGRTPGKRRKANGNDTSESSSCK